MFGVTQIKSELVLNFLVSEILFQIYILSGLVGIEGLMLDVTWWSVVLTLRLPSLSPAVSSCVSPSLHLWSGGLWSAGAVTSFVLPYFYCINDNIRQMRQISRCFFLHLPSVSSFLSVIAEDTNWFPKENMFSFQTATTTMQAWVSSKSHVHKHTELMDHTCVLDH